MTEKEYNTRQTQNYALCPKCLSRIYRNPKDRDNSIIPLINNTQKCSICNNLLLNEDKIFKLILKKIKMLKIEFDTFLIATQINNQTITKNQKEIYKIQIIMEIMT